MEDYLPKIIFLVPVCYNADIIVTPAISDLLEKAVTIRIKLLGGFIIIAVIGAFLGAMGLYGNQKITGATEALLDLSLRESSVSEILNAHFNWRHTLSESVYNGSVFTGSLDPTACSLGIWLRGDEVKLIMDAEILSLINMIVEPHNIIHNEARTIVSFINKGQYDEAEKHYRELVLPKTQDVINDLNRLNDHYDELLNDKTQEIYDLGVTFAVIIIILIVAAFAASVILAFFITSYITKPINGVAGTLKDISEGEGDLTRRIDNSSKDEIGTLSLYFNRTLEKIRNLVISIKDESAELSETGEELARNMSETAAAVNQITAAIQSIKQRVINQSASVTETGAAMEQVTQNINKLNSHVEDQSGYISDASAAIEQMIANIQSVGETLVKNTANVKSLREASGIGRAGLEEVAADIRNIAHDSEGLLEINSVMKNIAGQTNLLSMNAAIEAAHAGEAGKGFAVVADEIRKLAESSGVQSKTIGAVLKKIKESMDRITKSTVNVLDKFEAIDSNVKIVAEQTNNIGSAMKEQEQGSGQILSGIALVTETTRQVKNGSSQMLDGAREVIGESGNLEKVTQEITLGMNEMATGAEQINLAIDHVNRISGRNREGIDNLIREVSRFKVD